MNIHKATQGYEHWRRSCTAVIEAHLRLKHKQMRESPFLVFRGTFYRWAQLWPDVCASLRDAPKVLAVGDLHVGSFGTWRVRLAASVKIVIDSEKLTIRFKEGCIAILEGYQNALKAGGCPFVLAEHEKNLDRLGVEAFKPPDGFWEKLDHLPVVRHGLPRAVKRVLREMLPNPNLDYKVVRREAGLGSLGQQRFVAIASWEGGHIAR